MDHPSCLSLAAEEWIDRYVQQQTVQAAGQLNGQQTAEELLGFLSSGEKMSTPGFVLRRHIQAQGLTAGEDCADLRRTGNKPWPPECVRRAAQVLSDLSYQSCGRKGITPAAWERYLNDDLTQGLQRRTIFKLAMVLGMGREETIDLLMACGQQPYQMREPLEFLCWFCQWRPNSYRWSQVEELLQAYQRQAALRQKEGEPLPPPLEGETRLLGEKADELLKTGAPAAETEAKLLALMQAHCGQFSGVSLTARRSYLRLLDYLGALYLPQGRFHLKRLIAAIYQKQAWDFSDLFQTPRGERYVFRGEAEEKESAIPQRETHVFYNALGEIAMFCKRYYLYASAIQRGDRGVERRDVLLLGYFLLTGYQSAGAQARERFWALPEEGTDMDRRIALLREDLEDLARQPSGQEKQILCRRVLNELLAEFGLRPLYIPGAFDRFVLLTLLTQRPSWTARYLMGENPENG